MKLKILFPLIVVAALLGAAFIGITSVHAQQSNTPSSGLIQMLVNKFNLNQTDVQAVFDQYRANQKNQRGANYRSMLDQAVTDGKITPAQEQLILAKHQDLKTWASQNHIDLKYLFGGLGHGPRGMRGTPTP